MILERDQILSHVYAVNILSSPRPIEENYATEVWSQCSEKHPQCSIVSKNKGQSHIYLCTHVDGETLYSHTIFCDPSC